MTVTARSEASVSQTPFSQSRLRTFVFVFSLSFPVLYVICEIFGAPLFTYHPATNRFDLGWSPGRSGEGPAMHWYGWVASSILGSSLVGLIGSRLPDTTTKRIPLILLIMLPTLGLIPLAYSLMPYWTKGWG
jgi:hypothetical protein